MRLFRSLLFTTSLIMFLFTGFSLFSMEMKEDRETVTLIIKNIDYLWNEYGPGKVQLTAIGIVIREEYKLLMLPQPGATFTTMLPRKTNCSLYTCEYATEGDENNNRILNKVLDYNIMTTQQLIIEVHDNKGNWLPIYKIQAIPRSLQEIAALSIGKFAKEGKLQGSILGLPTDLIMHLKQYGIQ